MTTEAQSLIVRIQEAMIGSCTCLTKTPNPDYHPPNCRYRVLHEAEVELQGVLPILPETAVAVHGRKMAEDFLAGNLGDISREYYRGLPHEAVLASLYMLQNFDEKTKADFVKWLMAECLVEVSVAAT